jgi:hypothetical protein
VSLIADVSIIKTRRADHLIQREDGVARLHRDFHSAGREEVAWITTDKAFLPVRIFFDPSVGASQFYRDFGHKREG